MREDLGNPLILKPHLSKFLSEARLPDGEDGPEWSEIPKPPLDDPKKWVAWWAHQVVTPAWWPELVKVPNPRDPVSCTKCMHASFQFPKVKYLQGEWNDCTTPPVPHCIEWDAFLPQAKGNFGSLGYWLWQPKKTLAMVKSLQFGQTRLSHPGPMIGSNWQNVSVGWGRKWS